MKISTGISIIIIILGFFIYIPIHRFFSISHHSPKINRILNSDTLYFHTISGTAMELKDVDFIRKLDGTLLSVREENIRQFLAFNFLPIWINEKSLEFHEKLMDYFHTLENDTQIIHISLAREQDHLFQTARTLFEQKLSSLPPCSNRNIGNIGWETFKKEFIKESSDIEFLEKLPNCRPPAFIRNAILNSLEKRIQKLQNEIPDSIAVLPAKNESGNRRYSESAWGMILSVRSYDKWLWHRQYLFWSVPVLSILFLAFQRKSISLKLKWAGYSFLISGILLMIGFLAVQLFSKDSVLFFIFPDANPTPWIKLVDYTIKQIAFTAAKESGIIGGILFLFGLLFYFSYRKIIR